MNRKRKALLVFVPAILVIVFLLVVVLPSYIRARKQSCRNACINNLRQIETAKDQYGVSNIVINIKPHTEPPSILPNKASEPSVAPVPQEIIREDPGQPLGLTGKSSMSDIRRSGHSVKKVRYLHQHFPEEIAMKKMAEYYEKLPFVKSVSPQKTNSFRILVVTMKNGKQLLIDVSVAHPGSISSKEKDQGKPSK